MNGLSKDLQNRVLDRLGFSEPPAVNIEALQQLYASWCMHAG
jgi:hypothetical protein